MAKDSKKTKIKRHNIFNPEPKLTSQPFGCMVHQGAEERFNNIAPTLLALSETVDSELTLAHSNFHGADIETIVGIAKAMETAIISVRAMPNSFKNVPVDINVIPDLDCYRDLTATPQDEEWDDFRCSEIALAPPEMAADFLNTILQFARSMSEAMSRTLSNYKIHGDYQIPDGRDPSTFIGDKIYLLLEYLVFLRFAQKEFSA